MSFKVPERYRSLEHSSEQDGNNGLFVVPGKNPRHDLKVSASNAEGWEHVAVSKNDECPTWEEMCRVKALFWDHPEDWAVEYHPPRSKYVNNHPYCLHMWRPADGFGIISPPTYLMGLPI